MGHDTKCVLVKINKKSQVIDKGCVHMPNDQAGVDEEPFTLPIEEKATAPTIIAEEFFDSSIYHFACYPLTDK